jgi:transposase
MIYKRLGGDGGFSWPQISDGVLQLTRVQFEALFDGLNFKRVTERNVTAPIAVN